MADVVPAPEEGTGTLPVAPSLAPALDAVRAPDERPTVALRDVALAAVAVVVALGAAVIAQILTRLIGLITNLSFYGRISTAFSAPTTAVFGALTIAVPVVGGVIVGVMARYGSAAIRGHGIPEVMERILFAGSRIPARVTFLKPLSAAIAIGTGGPFGAEGPIIASGGALGSLVGQALSITADERKILLAAGAAAGMAATFGSPISAVLLAVELLLFEYRARSLIPVALAAATSAAARIPFAGTAPMFAMPHLAQPSSAALVAYTALGALMGAVAVAVTASVYWVEDGFERLPVHWMWWPAIGGLAVGVVGYIAPRTLGVGYGNIQGVLAGSIVGRTLLLLLVLKFVSWSIALGSGTSGGTLAPLFTLGGALGALLGTAAVAAAPWLGVDPRLSALVGMAAMFAGASHAVLTSVVFVFETTREPAGLLPLLAGGSAAYLVSLLLSRHSIMTAKLARRGATVRTEYVVDVLSSMRVADVATRDVVALRREQTLDEARSWMASGAHGAGHQGYPVVDAQGRLCGLVTRRLIMGGQAAGARCVGDLVSGPPAVAFDDTTLREAADLMLTAHVGRLPVVDRGAPERMVGIVSRSDLLSAQAERLAAATLAERGLSLAWPVWRRGRARADEPPKGA